MAKKQYISQLTQAGQGIRGNDVLEKDRVRVIDGLCNVIAEKDTAIAEKDVLIADQATLIAAMGIDLSTTSVNRWQHALANRLFGLYQLQMELMLSSIYQHIEKDELLAVVTLYCMAHARRKFEAIKDPSPEARKVLEYIAVLYMLEANLKDRKATHDEIRQERQQKAVPILGVLRKMMEKYKTVDTPQSALTKACNMLGIEPYRYFMAILPRLCDNMTTEQLTAMLPYKVAEELKNK